MKSSKNIVEEYLKKRDWRVKENSSNLFSIGGLNKYANAEVFKDYWLREVYPEEISQAYINNYIHIHDLGGMTLYCCGYSLKDILLKGVVGIDNIPTSSPAKHFDSVLNQVSNMLTVFQNEIMGAVALNSFDTLLAPFIKNDRLTYDQVKQSMQNYIYSINSNSRMGAEPAFSNITFDLTPPHDLLDEYVIIGGELQSFTYRSCQREMDMLNKAFFEIMLNGDARGKLFSYPIPTYNIHKRFDWDNPNNKLLWELTGKFGTPYFANYINSDMNPEDARSMCCRLRLDLTELRKRNGGLFGSGDSTGCYDDKTEVLTKNRGWTLFKDLNVNDVLITRNKDGRIETHKPDKIFKYPYNDKMYHFENSRFDMMVTPNHNMVYCNKYTGKQELVRADQYSRTKHPIPKTATYMQDEQDYFELPEISSQWTCGSHDTTHTKQWKPIRIRMDLWLEFLGWFLTEGSCDNENIAPSHGYRVVITQFKKKNRKIIESILNRLPFNYKKTDTDFIINNKQLWNYCKQFGDCYDRFVPRTILNECSSRQLNILLDTMILGDGSVNKINGQKTYYTASKRLADDFQELCLKCGFAANIRERQPRGCTIEDRYYHKEQCSICYELTVSNSKYYYINNKDIKQVDYNGFVYCCEVKNHTLMVRRNGKATWCGNSIGVVTINLPRIAYESKMDKDKFYDTLDKYLDIAKRSLVIKRKWLQENIIDSNAIPAYNEYVGTMNNHFSTIGIIGMNEMCENFFDDNSNILSEKGKSFAEEVGEHIRNRLLEYQAETGNLFNYEATPAESTSYRFALNDKKTYPDIITQGVGKDCYYTNSCHIPVKYIDGIDSTFKHQEKLQSQFTGGTVIHLMMEGAITGEQAKEIIKSTFTNYTVPYVSISPISRFCPEHGYINEIVDKCPICKTRLKKYQRITGYLRCVDNFNIGKKAEFIDRKQLNKENIENEIKND